MAIQYVIFLESRKTKELITYCLEDIVSDGFTQNRSRMESGCFVHLMKGNKCVHTKRQHIVTIYFKSVIDSFGFISQITLQ